VPLFIVSTGSARSIRVLPVRTLGQPVTDPVARRLNRRRCVDLYSETCLQTSWCSWLEVCISRMGMDRGKCYTGIGHSRRPLFAATFCAVVLQHRRAGLTLPYHRGGPDARCQRKVLSPNSQSRSLGFQNLKVFVTSVTVSEWFSHIHNVDVYKFCIVVHCVLHQKKSLPELRRMAPISCFRSP